MEDLLASLVAQMVKNPASNAKDPGSIPGLGRSIPVFLSGEFHGQKSLVGYCPRGLKELAELSD